jgi:hypothetical protein
MMEEEEKKRDDKYEIDYKDANCTICFGNLVED